MEAALMTEITRLRLCSVGQRRRTGSRHLPLIGNVSGPLLGVHPPHSIPHHQGGSHHVRLNRFSIASQRGGTIRDQSEESPHLKRTNKNIFHPPPFVYLFILQPVCCLESQAELPGAEANKQGGSERVQRRTTDSGRRKLVTQCSVF